MEIIPIGCYVFLALCCFVLCFCSVKLSKENVELRKDLRIVLHHIPVANSAEYVHLVKKYAVKDLNFKEQNKNGY